MPMADIPLEVLEFLNDDMPIFTEILMNIVCTIMVMGSNPFIPLRNNANNAQDFKFP